ncbi:MAG: sulfite exporter TauE/SafE family protein [bacterium]|nr:sulfite exporter TauE/SafE family protein [bacterium]
MRLRLFFLWLLAFTGSWLYLVVSGDHWEAVRQHWGIAVAMALGSYFGASTPMGGGAVGFPVLVLLFDEPAAVGRDFSFAIQSAGMLSASLFIFATGRPVAWPILGWTLVAGVMVVPLATVLLLPLVPPLVVKLLFAVIWAAFGIAHFAHRREIEVLHGPGAHTAARDLRLGLTIGVAGGLVTAATGVGVNMLLYMVLVMLLRGDTKIAIPTSVIAMASLSIVGLATRALLGDIQHEVYLSWLAPLGAWMVQVLPRAPTLWIVSTLCLVQFVWTCVHERVTGLPLALAVAGAAACVLAFEALHRRGRRLPPLLEGRPS